MSTRLRRTDLDTSVAASLDASARLLPYLSRLLEGVEALGSSPRRVVNWLREAGIESRHVVLDLGCGKGAVSVALARRLGCRVRGVDGLEAFIHHARSMAVREGVADKCEFRRGDVGSRLWPLADAVIMLGVLEITESLALARSRVRQGGVYIIDDAVALERSRPTHPRPDGHRPTRRGVRSLIEDLGDTILREHVMSPAAYRAYERRIFASISKAARTLVMEHPELSEEIQVFLANQRRSGSSLWRGPWRGATWMVRRSCAWRRR